MISEHILNAGGRNVALKLPARAMKRIEDESGKPIAKALEAIADGGFDVSMMILLLRNIMNGGAGASEDEACDLIDEIGLEASAEAIFKATKKGFGKAEKPAVGNAKGRKAAQK